jgi:hypothetical protein
LIQNFSAKFKLTIENGQSLVVVSLVDTKLENVVQWISDDIENCWNKKWKCFVKQKREQKKINQRVNKFEIFWLLKQKVDSMMEHLKKFIPQFAERMV